MTQAHCSARAYGQIEMCWYESTYCVVAVGILGGGEWLRCGFCGGRAERLRVRERIRSDGSAAASLTPSALITRNGDDVAMMQNSSVAVRLQKQTYPVQFEDTGSRRRGLGRGFASNNPEETTYHFAKFYDITVNQTIPKRMAHEVLLNQGNR